MRQFHSYGPVKPEIHFYVERDDLVNTCLTQIIGTPEEGGHFFTIWAPRQTGKTWLMEEVERHVLKTMNDQFAVFRFSVGVMRELDDERFLKEGDEFPEKFADIVESHFPSNPKINSWKEFELLFYKDQGIWDRPVLLFIDEVDSCPQGFIDLMVNRFREMYLNRGNHFLHGLALAGVRAVLGVDSKKGSPFNIQRSIRVPNLSREETEDLFRQYQEESGQTIESEVVTQVYEKTLGQPGLVCWFGELLTEKYNPDKNQVIGNEIWEEVWLDSRTLEPNNTVMNLIAKARLKEYQPFLAELFSRAEIEFLFHDPLHNYLYLNGIIAPEKITSPDGKRYTICRFTSPFVQECLFQTLSRELSRPIEYVALVNPLDDLSDALDGPVLNLPALLERYKGYLDLLKSKGINPWKEQPRRKQDWRITEAVGHFHLYHWLQNVIGKECVVSPEFPTGNGKVDLHIRFGKKRGIIEVKSFTNPRLIQSSRQQAANYARQLELDAVTIALFVPYDDEEVLKKLSGTLVHDKVTVTTVAIRWT